MTDYQVVAQAVAGHEPNDSGWVRIDCPLCGEKTGKEDKRRSFGFNAQTLGYSCFKCGSKGRLRQAPDGLDLAEVEIKPAAPPPYVGPPEGFTLLASEEGRSSMALAPARRYLMGRNVGPDIWKLVGIGACAYGRQEGRVVVPVLWPDGKWAGWVGRAWIKRHPLPYVYPPGMQRGDVLYNGSCLEERTDEPVLVVEGVFDAIALWPRAVAVLGKPSHHQVGMLASAKRPVAVVLDGDALDDALGLVLKLRMAGQVAGMVRLAPKVDPDEVPRQWLLAEAVRCLEIA